MTLTVVPVPILADNYAWLLHDGRTGVTAIVDPAEVAPIEAAIMTTSGRLDWILLTHHHNDHTAATDELRARFGAKVAGAAADAARLPALDRALSAGDTIAIGAHTARILETPGHTIGHIAYAFADPPLLFCGDTLFSLGCGRLFEGTPAQMFASLAQFASLPDDTLICCGHEYTQGNAAFALSRDPENPELQSRARWIAARRAAGRPTLPSRLADERRENPFLRAPTPDALAELRRAKDAF